MRERHPRLKAVAYSALLSSRCRYARLAVRLQTRWEYVMAFLFKLEHFDGVPAFATYAPFAYSSAVRDSNSNPTTGSSPTTHAS